MDKKSLLISGIAVFLAVLLVITYQKERALNQQISAFQQTVTNAKSNQEIRKAMTDLFNNTGNSGVEFLKSKASEFGGAAIKIDAVSASSGTTGTRVTLTGSNISLPAYILFGGGIVESAISSDGPNSVSFTIPSKVLVPSCPPFPATICNQLGITTTSNGQELAITAGKYAVYLATSNGSVSNPVSFEVLK